MSAEQLVIIALLVAAFVAGWMARGPREPDAEEPGAEPEAEGAPAAEASILDAPTQEYAVAAPVTAPMPVGAPAPAPERSDPGRSAAGGAPARPEPVRVPAGGPDRPDPIATALKALDRALAAYEAAVDRWLDEGPAITPAGKAAVGELDRAIKRLDLAAGRVAAASGDRSPPYFATLDALDALQEAAGLVGGFREGRPLDGAASRELDRLEGEWQGARAELAAASGG